MISVIFIYAYKIDGFISYSFFQTLGKLLHPARTFIRQSALQNPGRFLSTEVSATTATQSTNVTPKTEDLDKLYSKLEIELKGSDPAVLKSYSWFATTAAGHLGVELGKR